uniref:TOG domain-containing protein n=1 Tax=Anolis carolinensis TaxID=28377 RepID=A0A803U0E7_ANOCA
MRPPSPSVVSQDLNPKIHSCFANRFKIQCRIKLSTEALPLFTQLLDECWVEGKITRYPKCLHAVLGLMMNLSLQHSLVIQEFAEEITQKCMSLVNSKEGRIVTRAIGLLSHILPVSLVALEEAMKQGVVKKMIKFLKTGEEATSGYALKTLAACVRNSRQAQEQIVKSDKKCSTFLKLLRSQNDVVVGNAAFCLGKCLEVPGMATNLLDTNVVKILLKVAGREAEKTQAQENAAIALGKLCNADARQVSPQDHAEYLWAPELVEGTLSKTLRLYNKREEGGLNIQAQCREDASSPPGISSEM